MVLIMGVLAGLFNGFVNAKFKIPTFIITVATMGIFIGIGYAIIHILILKEYLDDGIISIRTTDDTLIINFSCLKIMILYSRYLCRYFNLA